MVSTDLQSFSLYSWVTHAASQAGVGLRQLADSSIPARGTGRFTADVRAMLHWCRVNELLTLERHASTARVFAGFERASRLQPVLKRYERLAQSANELCIFAELDVDVSLDVPIVDVAGTPLAREWFLVIDAIDYTALLAARDLTGFGPTGPLQNRRFEGLTLHDASIVKGAALALSRLVGTPALKRQSDSSR